MTYLACPHTLLAGMKNGVAAVKTSVVAPQKVRCRDWLPSDSTCRYLPKKTENRCPHRNLCWMSLTALSIIPANWKQPKCPSTGNGQNKCGFSIQCNIYYPTMKRNEVLIDAPTMTLKNIMLSERRQTQLKPHMISLRWKVQNRQSQRDGN